MLRSAVQIGAIVCVSSGAQAGVVVELVPDNPGPYFGGESVRVDVWLDSDVSWPLLLRTIQFDFSDSDPALGLDSTFAFNFSAVPSGGGGYFSSLYPELPVPFALQSLDCGCPGEYFHLRGDGSLLIGSIGVQLSSVPGVYRIDMLNADESDELLGGAIRTAPWLPEFPPPSFYWRAFTGDITGGAYDFVVIPEPATGMLVLGGLLALQFAFRRRRGRAGLAPGLVLAAVLACAGTASAQPMAVPAAKVAVQVDSGGRSAGGSGGDLTVVFSQVLSVHDAPWVRLHFADVTFSGSRAQGNESFLRVTSLEDGAVQILDSDALGTWADSTAYFNGDRVLLELLAYPGTGNSRVAVDTIGAGAQGAGPAAGGMCYIEDRVQSYDPRAARLFYWEVLEYPGAYTCSSFLVDRGSRSFLTAGHCCDGMGFGVPNEPSSPVAEFNVPDSEPDGTINHPGPEDQYPLDEQSLQFEFDEWALGLDWCYFGVFDNTTTDLSPLEAQGATYRVADGVPQPNNSTLLITGYGDDGTPLNLKRVQQTDTGEYEVLEETAPIARALGYSMYTRPGNSGSPVENVCRGLI